MTFGSALGLLFIGLKLGGVINWSWWWVLCPFWIIVPILLAIYVLAFVGLTTKEALHVRALRKRRFPGL